MPDSIDSTSEPTLNTDLETIAATVQRLGQEHQHDIAALLKLLRLLEQLHRDIQDDVFQMALPDSRQGLHNLLRDMETTGGWPYIPRMTLRALVNRLRQNPSSPDTEVAITDLTESQRSQQVDENT